MFSRILINSNIHLRYFYGYVLRYVFGKLSGRFNLLIVESEQNGKKFEDYSATAIFMGFYWITSNWNLDKWIELWTDRGLI